MALCRLDIARARRQSHQNNIRTGNSSETERRAACQNKTGLEKAMCLRRVIQVKKAEKKEVKMERKATRRTLRLELEESREEFHSSRKAMRMSSRSSASSVSSSSSSN